MLHIYSPKSPDWPNNAATIMGTKEDLKRLKDAIDNALTGSGESLNVLDSQGFTNHVSIYYVPENTKIKSHYIEDCVK